MVSDSVTALDSEVVSVRVGDGAAAAGDSDGAWAGDGAGAGGIRSGPGLIGIAPGGGTTGRPVMTLTSMQIPR